MKSEAPAAKQNDQDKKSLTMQKIKQQIHKARKPALLENIIKELIKD